MNLLVAMVEKVSASRTHTDAIKTYIHNEHFLNEDGYQRYLSYLPSPPPELSLLKMNPRLSKQWHYKKNKPLRPEKFTSGSKKRVWWKCPKEEDHEWKASIDSRNRHRGCPFCTGNKVSVSNSLMVKKPKVAEQWHPTKNGDLKPIDFTAGSDQKVWWKCPKEEDHEWLAVIKSRSRGSGCPFCAGQKPSTKNNFAVLFPEICKEWHPTKNGALKPEHLTYGSKQKVWWKCKSNSDHYWESTVNNRTNPNNLTGCPLCANKTNPQ